MTDLAESCAAITAWLPIAQALTAEPDDDGTTAVSGQPGSKPPWNPAAEAAFTDPYEGLRRLEATWRILVNGHPGPRRGSSDANTYAAVKAITRLASGLPVTHVYAEDANGRRQPCRCPHCRYAWLVDWWARQIQQLPAVDQDEAWQRRPGVACPYCGFEMLRVKPRAGEVTCLRYGACFDADGNHPAGTMEVGRLGPQVRWNDGLVAP